MHSGDTIVAISSATGPAGRMIVRVSGPNAHCLACRFCRELPENASATLQRLEFNGLVVPAWVYVFRSPRSYTAEDLVELHVPGNPVLATMLMSELESAGARRADPGEFTARAYFNGRIDLTEAEGVAATIAAQNAAELKAARQLMAGELSNRVQIIMDRLVHVLALVEASIDFADEGITPISPAELGSQLTELMEMLDRLLAESSRFDSISHEPTVVLAGRPNAGKSTLLNALSGQDRAVVSAVAGTTRDAIWAHVALPSGMIRLLDVAGLDPAALPRKEDAGPAAQIARQMHDQAMAHLASADFVLLVIDVTDSEPALALPRAVDLVVFSKSDLADSKAMLPAHTYVSAQSGFGIDALRRRLDALVFGQSSSTATVALNQRHVRAIEQSRHALNQGRMIVGQTTEIIALTLREAVDHLAQVTGTVSPDDVLGRIFSSFCIGK